MYSFTQSLPMRVRGPLIEVEGELGRSEPGRIGDLSYEQRGEFSYEVLLEADSPFGRTVLGPPAAVTTASVPPTQLAPGAAIIPGLVDSADMSFSYSLETSRPASNVSETVSVEAVLENPGKWSKTIELVPLSSWDGDFSVTFPLDLEGFSRLIDTIQQETGVPASSRELSIRARVKVSADTDAGMIDEDFTHSVRTNLRGDVIVWSDNLTSVKPGVFTTAVQVPVTTTFLGLPVSQVRVLLIVLTGVFLALLVVSLLWYIMRRPEELPPAEKAALYAQRKYKGIIVEAEALPEAGPGETVIALGSLGDLVKTAEGLLKPVLHRTEGQSHVYYVFDGATRYQYHAKGRSTSP